MDDVVLLSANSRSRLKKPSKDPPVALGSVAIGCRLFPVEDLARATSVSRRVMNRMLRDAAIAVTVFGPGTGKAVEVDAANVLVRRGARVVSRRL
jgi:hypothetical protein